MTYFMKALYKLTDSHCHLDFENFTDKREGLLSTCYQQGIHRMIIPSVDPKNWQSVLALTNSTNQLSVSRTCQLLPSLGIHPWFLKNLNQSHLDALALMVAQHKNQVIAIGETGIDGVIAKQENNLAQQIHFFEFQLQLAKAEQLPVIVHHRQSHQHIFTYLKAVNLNEGGIIHAFSGSYQEAKQYIDLGFKLGVGGTITYPRAIKTQKAIKKVPLSSLVLETDAPAMPIFEQQGKDNSPLFLLAIFEKLVALRQMREENQNQSENKESAQQIAEHIEMNINQLFKLNSN